MKETSQRYYTINLYINGFRLNAVRRIRMKYFTILIRAPCLGYKHDPDFLPAAESIYRSPTDSQQLAKKQSPLTTFYILLIFKMVMKKHESIKSPNLANQSN